MITPVRYADRFFYFIGNSDPEDTKNKHMSVKHMLVKGQMSIKTRL